MAKEATTLDVLPVATDADGNELEGTVALKRALLQLKEEVGTLGVSARDDAASDAPAIAEGTYAIATLQMYQHLASFGSITTASAIVLGIDYQRYRKQVEYKHVLGIYAEYRINVREHEKEFAAEQLRKRMGQSTLEFQDLDKKYDHKTFRVTLFDEERKKYGVRKNPKLPEYLTDYSNEQNVKSYFKTRLCFLGDSVATLFTVAGMGETAKTLIEKIDRTSIRLGNYRFFEPTKSYEALDEFGGRIVRQIGINAIPNPKLTKVFAMDIYKGLRAQWGLIQRYEQSTGQARGQENTVIKKLLAQADTADSRMPEVDTSSPEYRTLEKTSFARHNSVRNAQFTSGLFWLAGGYIGFMATSAAENLSRGDIPLVIINAIGITLASRPLANVGLEAAHSTELADTARAEEADAEVALRHKIEQYRENAPDAAPP